MAPVGRGSADGRGLRGRAKLVRVGRRSLVPLSERLIYWTEPHPGWEPNPEWPEEVGCVMYAGPEAVVLIDPLIRDDLDDHAWEWLDAAVAAVEPVVVLLTAPWHERSTRKVVARYNARVWAPPAAHMRMGDLPLLDHVPQGIDVFAPRGVQEGQVAFWLEKDRSLVVAEFFLGTSSGLQVLPSPNTHDLHEFIDSLYELEQLPVERVLVAHGPPVLSDGVEAISTALRAFSIEP